VDEADFAAVDTTKSAYAHAFVVLAATSGVRAGISGASELLSMALEVFYSRFFDAKTGLLVDEYNQDFTVLSPYRGVNANMHAVEALLAAGDVTGDLQHHERALAIAKVVALEWAPAQSWRIPEHFDSQWNPLLEFNAEKPDDQFKPYGATVGHGIEWARLLLHLDATFGSGWWNRHASCTLGQLLMDGEPARAGIPDSCTQPLGRALQLLRPACTGLLLKHWHLLQRCLPQQV